MVRRRNILLSLLDAILIVSTILSAMALCVALLARWITPLSTTFFAFFALGAPLLYFANLLLMALWIARWRRWAFVPAVVLVFGIWTIGDFVQMRWAKHYDDHAVPGELVFLTYNVHNFRLFNADQLPSVELICQYINEQKPDVVFLQEYNIVDSLELIRFDALMSGYRYRAYQHNVNGTFAHFGQVILSRFPLSGARTIHFEGSENSVLVADMYHPTDTIRLFGCHLQTTAFNAVNGERGLRNMISDKNRDSLAKSAFDALDENFVKRSVQADTLRHWIDNSLYPVVVAGDFNSPPLTYTYHTVRGELSDAFCEKGEWYGYTYKPMKGLFRIDYVLFDDQKYDAISYDSPNLPYSDHNPVKVRLIKK